MDKETATYIVDVLDFLKDHMVTKEEFGEFRLNTQENFDSLRSEVRDIRQRLDALEDIARNSVGLTKEIDHLMECVRVIEQHLNIKRTAVA
jgi:hypothetical protein